MGQGHFLLTENGRRIRQCYLQSKIRYDQFVHTKRPLGASLQEFRDWNDWCAARYGALLANRDEAIEEALARKRKEKQWLKRKLKQASQQRRQSR